MVSYPLIEKGQWSHKYAFLRASGATLLHLGASLERVNGAIILENGLVPPCSILLAARLYSLATEVDQPGTKSSQCEQYLAYLMSCEMYTP